MNQITGKSRLPGGILSSIFYATLLWLLTQNSWAVITAQLNQTTVYEGDPVELVIESDRKLSDKPDLSPLGQDFQVQGTSQSSNFSMINGNTSYTQRWTITLLPKRKGQLTIPAISVGSETTAPLALTVAEITPEAQAQTREFVTLEAIADVGASLPYVQQQIPYTLRLYTDESVIEGDMYEPSIENAVIERISRDKQYTVVRNGKRFNVLERRYVISPERSGKLLIPPALFKGQQRQQQRSRQGGGNGFNDPFFNDPFFSNIFRSPGKPISTRSDSIEITVQPIPQSYTGKNWLPAEDVVINDSWDKKLPVFKVGEPVVRTLTWQTKGLTGSQIPDMSLPQPENMRLYPDQVHTETKTDGKTVFGLRRQEISYIPGAAGKVTIPAMQIDWWNVLTGKQEVFTIPAREVEVLAGAGGRGIPVPVEKAAQQASQDKLATPQTPLADETKRHPSSRLLWLGLVLIAACVAGLYWWRRQRQQRPPAGKAVASASDTPSNRQLLSQLQQACQQQEASTVARLLLQLAQLQWPEQPPGNLGVLAGRLQQGADAIRELDRTLYANDGDSWDCQALWEAVKNGLVPKSGHVSAVSEDGLTSLYPKREQANGL